MLVIYKSAEISPESENKKKSNCFNVHVLPEWTKGVDTTTKQ